MCFSAKASFLASGLLLTVGAATLTLARRQQDRHTVPLAMAPLFFGVQQAVEGLVWLGMGANPQSAEPGGAPIQLGAVLAYLFFAYAFWPVWIPWSAVHLLTRQESPDGLPRWLPALGGVGGGLLWLPLLLHPHMALPEVIGHSLAYPLPPWSERLLPGGVGPVLYAAWIVVPLLLARSPRVRVFGLSLLLAFGVTKWMSSQALASVWCYASALLSGQILWILLEKAPLDQIAPPLAERATAQS